MKFGNRKIFLTIFLLLVLAGMLWTCSRCPRVEITFASANHGEDVKFFYCSEGESYTDEKIVVEKIERTSLQKYCFYISEQFDNIRVCFGESAGAVNISEVRIRESFTKEIVFSAQTLLDYGVFTDSDVEVQEGMLLLGRDEENVSELHLNTQLAGKVQNTWDISTLLSVILVAGLITILLYVIRKYFCTWKDNCKQFLIKNYAPIRRIVILLGALGLVVFFFALPMLFTYDTSVYYEYTNFFDGKLPWNSWGKSRGWGFPLFLWISGNLFGETAYGISIAYFIMYAVFVLAAYKLFKCYFSRYRKVIGGLIFSIFILLNPIILGYYHLILTEGVAATICVVTVLLILKIQENILQYGNERKYFIQKLILISVSSTYLYFVKQMFFVIPIIVYVACEIYLIVVKKHKIRGVLIGTVLTLCVLFGALKCWNVFLGQSEDETYSVINTDEIDNKDLNASGNELMSTYITRGAVNFELNEDENCIEVSDDGEIVDKISYTGEIGQLEYLSKCFTSHPLLFLQGYVDNYLVLANYYTLEIPENYLMSIAEIQKEPSLTRGLENETLAFYPKYYGQEINTYEQMGTSENLEKYGAWTDENFVTEYIYNVGARGFASFVYTISMLYAPIAMVLHIIFAVKKKENMFHGRQAILSGTVFLYGVALSMLCMRIDRYMFPVLVFAIIVLIADVAMIIEQVCKFVKCKMQKEIAVNERE